MFIHRYECEECGACYYSHHREAVAHWDDCPECCHPNNVPYDIERVPDADA